MILTFNTGCKYSARGQRIAAVKHDELVYFVDCDRMINGVFNAPIELTQSAIMTAYLTNKYSMVYAPEIFKSLYAAID